MPFLKDWSFTHIDVDGHSGGLITAWIPFLKEVYSCNLDNVLKIVLEDNNIGVSFTILNVYGPFHNHRYFWVKIASSRLWEDQIW